MEQYSMNLINGINDPIMKKLNETVEERKVEIFLEEPDSTSFLHSVQLQLQCQRYRCNHFHQRRSLGYTQAPM